MKNFNVPEEWKKQWRKQLTYFYDYIPTRFRADKREWKVRKMVWKFKDGKHTDFVANLVADKIIQDFKTRNIDIKNFAFACIPASTNAKNTARYKRFAEIVCKKCGCKNAFKQIKIEEDRLAIHENRNHKMMKSVNLIKLGKSFFKGKKVILFDDVITRGHTYARFATELERLGADVICGYFLARTILKIY